MSRITSAFVAKAGLSLAGLCAVVAVAVASSGGASASTFDECPPPTTVTVGPDGNPWHG
jgi:hypothetical protein